MGGGFAFRALLLLFLLSPTSVESVRGSAGSARARALKGSSRPLGRAK